MNIKELDLNLLRLFDATHRLRSVSRAADALDISQPAASQGLARLRVLLRDPLFVRAAGGVRPTPRADRLAQGVRSALGTLEQALTEVAAFEPHSSRRVFRLHMSDIGEGRFLPELLAALRERAPQVRIETLPLAMGDITDALDSARIDFAFGFLPKVRDTRREKLFNDRYVVLLRADHPLAGGDGPCGMEQLSTLEYVAVRTHADTLRILQLLDLEDRLRLTIEHFLVLPAIVRATDLGAVMPLNIARGMAQGGDYAILEPGFPLRDFIVSLHWSPRFEDDPGNRWFRALARELFADHRRAE